jgi:hypothetical protein
VIDQSETEPLLERDLARILPAAATPSVPPLPAGFHRILAARAGHVAPQGVDLPLLASGISAACLPAIILFSMHHGLPQNLRLLAGFTIGANVLLGSLATLALIFIKRMEKHAKA